MTENSVLLSLKQRYMWGGMPCYPATHFDAANSALELLRLNVQEPFSKEVLGIVAKFREKYFLPAMKNIKENLGEHSITDEQIHRVCVALLVGAKDFLETKWNEEEENGQGESSAAGSGKSGPRKRKEMEIENLTPTKRSNTIPETTVGSTIRPQKTPKTEINFVLESQASKVFERERILAKHPELTNYQPDFQDREWLVSQKIIPSRNTPATLLLHEELIKLAEGRPEYRNSVKVGDLQILRLPEFMLKKINSGNGDLTKTQTLKPKSSLSSSHATLSALLAKQTDLSPEET